MSVKTIQEFKWQFIVTFQEIFINILKSINFHWYTITPSDFIHCPSNNFFKLQPRLLPTEEGKFLAVLPKKPAEFVIQLHSEHRESQIPISSISMY